MSVEPYATRLATPADVDAIAAAHRDSIQSIGPAYYPAAVVAEWQAAITGSLYLHAMDRGEVFFIACPRIAGATFVLGFSSDYPIDGTVRGTSVYVRGSAVRRGIGSALLRLAEAQAVERGATGVRIEASLAGVAFYAAHGFIETGRGETILTSGRAIACVFMEKSLRYPPFG